jgi:hypothetical protein
MTHEGDDTRLYDDNKSAAQFIRERTLPAQRRAGATGTTRRQIFWSPDFPVPVI